MIDEHAGQLIADRLVNEDGGDGGIDAAGQPANHPALADLRADFLDRLVLEGTHRPVAGTAGDLAHKVAQDGGAVRRVDDFKMELRGVELARLIGDHRDWCIERSAAGDEALGRSGDAITVAHPHRITLADFPNAVIERRRFGHLHFGAAEFAVMAAFDLAAELLRHRLLAIADAEHRHAGLIDRHRRERRVLVEHGRRPAGEDHAFRPQLRSASSAFSKGTISQ